MIEKFKAYIKSWWKQHIVDDEPTEQLICCKVCEGKGYHKLSCPNNTKKPVKINVDIKPKQR
tara:strand:+ start:264 stop:449 length:186 start_codon:yes stop_codon:yes gene_type:complete